MTAKRAKARAPASIGNVAAGYDCLGLAFGAAWDTITAHREAAPGVRLGCVSGLVAALPDAVSRNTALRAAGAALEAGGADFGVRLDLAKGIPLSAGMGGSAASAVAAALAVNALLPMAIDRHSLFACALEGECASSDPPPPDNVAAALYGDLVLISSAKPPVVTPLPLPTGLTCLLFHPALEVNTDAARKCLARTVPLQTAIAQMRHLGALVAGCCRDDKALIRQGLRDDLVEPQRAVLVPPFAAVKQAALTAGALGCSLSGSGPSVFAWVEHVQMQKVRNAMDAAFKAHGCAATCYQAPLAPCQAEVLP